jgi:hypothetical protein
VDGDKVHHGVVRAGVHDEAPVVAHPHRHVTLASRKLLGGRILSNLVHRNQESEGTFAGSKGLNLSADDNFARDGLLGCQPLACQLE